MIIVEIAGHLGGDPETRMTPRGQKVTTLRVATNIRQGEKDDTIWWEVTIWGSEMENILKHLKKGSAVIVIGEMGRLDLYTDKEGRPQIGYKMTARMVKFSPFGKSDRHSSEHGPGSHAAPAGQHGHVSHAYSGGGGGHNGFGGQVEYVPSSFGTGQQAALSSEDQDAPPF